MGKKVFKALAAVAFVASFFVPGGIFISGGLLGTSYIAVSFATILQGVAAISATIGFAPELPNFDAARQLAENLVVTSNPNAIRGVAFGRTAMAGQVLFRENIKKSGDEPDELLVILALAGYPATSLLKFWLNGELVFDGESTTGPGAITTGKFANDLWVWFTNGEQTTEPFPEIRALSSTWDSKPRILRGIPAIGLRVKVREHLEGRLEPLAEFKGAKLYDPRLDSTVPGGSGSHRFNDPSTWAWSDNPKLAELLYLRGGYVDGVRIFGMGKPAAAIDLAHMASEANICDEQIPVRAGGTIKRYTCNGFLVPSRDHRANLEQLLSASAGTIDASEGVYRSFAGAWRAPVMTLTEADIDGAPTDIRLNIDPSEEKNIVSGAFADPNDGWQVKEYPEYRDADSIARVGEAPLTLDLPFTIDHRMAQRIAKIALKRRNAQKAFNANYWLSALPLQGGDIVTQVYSRYAINHTFRVHFWSMQAIDKGGSRSVVVPIQLIEEREEWFDWDAQTEEKDSNSITPLPAVDRNPKLINLDGVPTFVGPNPPANPKVGWLWRDTDTNITFRWDGSAWVDFATETKTADQIDYLSGATVESLRPAEPGADTTGPRVSGNVLINSSFETGTLEGWTPVTGSGWAVVADEPRFGSFNLEFQPPNDGTFRIRNDSRIQVSEGDRVLAQGFVHRHGSGTAETLVQIVFRDASGAVVSSPDGNVVTVTQYQASRVLAITPPGAVVAEFEFVIRNSTGPKLQADGAYMALQLRDEDITVQVPGEVDLDAVYEDDITAALPVSAGIVFTSDGFVQAYNNGGFITIGKWWTNAPEPGIGSSYQVRCSSADATWDFAAAAVGSWITMGSDRTWRIVRTQMEGAGNDFINAEFQIRAVGTTTVIDDTFFAGAARGV